MKVQILSDLHLEFYKQPRDFIKSLFVEAPTLILAGDIGSLIPAKAQWMAARIKDFCAKWEQIYYVPGNHEFYGTSLSEGLANLKRLQTKQFKYLGGARATRLGGPKGPRIWGDTMWFPDVGRINYPVNDFFQIRGFKNEYDAAHKGFVEKLNRIRPDIVVTHHLPSFKSVSGRYVDNSANWCYVANMEEYIVKHKPMAWFHGHSHDPSRVKVGETDIISNPRGYPHQMHADFDPELVVEL